MKELKEICKHMPGFRVLRSYSSGGVLVDIGGVIGVSIDFDEYGNKGRVRASLTYNQDLPNDYQAIETNWRARITFTKEKSYPQMARDINKRLLCANQGLISGFMQRYNESKAYYQKRRDQQQQTRDIANDQSLFIDRNDMHHETEDSTHINGYSVDLRLYANDISININGLSINQLKQVASLLRSFKEGES